MTVWLRASGSMTSCQFSQAPGDPVDQQQHRPGAGLDVAHRPAVERERPGDQRRRHTVTAGRRSANERSMPSARTSTSDAAIRSALRPKTIWPA